ncbi:MAG: Gfo/Idh/MocA family protein [Candidatus Hydrogenedentota bacterium]
MPKKFKVGIIGCGAISERLHVPDIYYGNEGELVAFCDVDKARAESMAERYGTAAKAYTDYNDLLADPSVEGVIIALPNRLHCKVTVAAAKAGKAAMIEKPMATSIEECQTMIDTAQKAGTLLMVNQSQRLEPAHRKAKEILDSALLGRVLHVTAMFGHGGPDEWEPSATWFFDKDAARFGAMADLGIHKADLVRYLVGKEVAEISAFAEHVQKLQGEDLEDNFVACLKFEDGAVGTLAASWTAYGGNNNYIIFHCENGTLRVGIIPDQPIIAQIMNPACEINFDPGPPAIDYPESWGVDAGGAFVRAALGLEPPYCSGEEGFKSLQLIFAAEEAAKTRKTVRLA